MESAPLRVAWLLGLGFACSACRPTAPRDPGASYLRDSSFRRSELVASLVNPSNEYSKLRLASYGVADGWDRLPVWNPRVEPVRAETVGAERSLSPEAAPLPLPAGVERDRTALLALGEAAYFRYPVQLVGSGSRLLASRESAARYGFWEDQEHGIGGLVRVALADGRTELAYTCATCHAAMKGDRLQIGVANAALDLGRLSIDAAGPVAAESSNAARNAAFRAWGPGRMDVSSAGGTEPVRIPDLRPVRYQSHLQADATVRQSGETGLAIRLETLIITSHQQALRPPREVTLALAAYLGSLADSVRYRPSQAPEVMRGAAVFQRTCAGCHRPPTFTGPPVAIEIVGTDATLGRSQERGTGTYAVPSLLGVAARRLLLHDGAVASLEALLSSTRTAAAMGRAGAQAETGHRFGLTLSDQERQALLAFLRSL